MTSPAALLLRQRILFGLLVLFLLGWFALPSTQQLANRPHNLLFWLGLLPVFLVLRLPQLWRVPRREPLVALAAAAIAWQVASIGWSQPPTELSVWRGLLDGLSTFVFVVASVDLLDERRAATLERWLAGAGEGVGLPLVGSLRHGPPVLWWSTRPCLQLRTPQPARPLTRFRSGAVPAPHPRPLAAAP